MPRIFLGAPFIQNVGAFKPSTTTAGVDWYGLWSIMVQMTEARDTFKDTAMAVDPVDSVARLDLAEELFVSCRFTEASKVCNDALNLVPTSSSTQSGRNRSEPASTERVVAFDDQLIAPVGECDTSDLIVAVLLQCGFELQKSEEWARCRAFYARRGAMPFAVATLWLRLCLAGGEFEFVRKVLWQLRDTLGEELHSEAPAVNIGGAGGEMARDNYFQATEMLVIQIMLPCGELGDARSLVSSDLHLGQKQKSQLLEACDQSSVRSGERPLSATGGASGANGADAPRTHQGSRRHVGGHQSNAFASPGDLERPTDNAPDGHQGPVQKFFSEVGDWTPEARLQLVVGAGAAGLAAYAACRNRHHLWRAARDAAGVAFRTAGDIGAFIVGSS